MTRYKSNYGYAQDLQELRKYSMEIARERDTLKAENSDIVGRITAMHNQILELHTEIDRLTDELELAHEALRREFKPQ